MKEIRDRLRLAPEGSASAEPLLRPAGSRRRSTREDDLLSISVPRHENRWRNMREDERHRLRAEEALVTTVDGERRTVALVNLSGGGAMIETDYVPEDLEPMMLDLGDGGEIEAAVRWVRAGRIGLEFAHETQLGCDAATRDALLLDTIRKSFPTANLIGMAQPSSAFGPNHGNDDRERVARGARRHPLIWSGEVHYDHDTHVVRLRNISADGALIESSSRFPVEAGLLLDLGGAGTIFATVSWSRGGQAGLRFEESFDVSRLAEAKPTLRSNWHRPDYLARHEEEARRPGGWAAHWDAPSIEQLREDLEGFIRH